MSVLYMKNKDKRVFTCMWITLILLKTEKHNAEQIASKTDEYVNDRVSSVQLSLPVYSSK